ILEIRWQERGNDPECAIKDRVQDDESCKGREAMQRLVSRFWASKSPPWIRGQRLQSNPAPADDALQTIISTSCAPAASVAGRRRPSIQLKLCAQPLARSEYIFVPLAS